MNEFFAGSTTIGVVISLAFYYFGIFLKNKFKSSLINPLLISIVLTLCFLLVFRIDYESYNVSGRYLSYLLTPATVMRSMSHFFPNRSQPRSACPFPKSSAALSRLQSRPSL